MATAPELATVKSLYNPADAMQKAMGGLENQAGQNDGWYETRANLRDSPGGDPSHPPLGWGKNVPASLQLP